MALLAITALLPRLRLLSLPWRPGCHRRCHPRTRVEKAPLAGPWLALFIWTWFLYLHRFKRYEVFPKLQYNSDWKEEKSRHEIVDAIECLALLFSGAFAWRSNYGAYSGLLLKSGAESTSSLPSFFFLLFLKNGFIHLSYIINQVMHEYGNVVMCEIRNYAWKLIFYESIIGFH